MNSIELRKVLEEHNLWITSMHESGSRANLSDADLRGANLIGSDLRGANLSDADLRGANLIGADLRGADLRDADLRVSDLSGSNLRDADLRGANLSDADLRGANLIGADLRGAKLIGADLRDADLPDNTFVIMGEAYYIQITNGEYVKAGCRNHAVDQWRKFTKREIAEMDGRRAIRFYPRLLDLIDFYLGKGERPEWVSLSEAE